jgi:hypothetical protein
MIVSSRKRRVDDAGLSVHATTVHPITAAGTTLRSYIYPNIEVFPQYIHKLNTAFGTYITKVIAN